MDGTVLSRANGDRGVVAGNPCLFFNHILPSSSTSLVSS